MVLKVAFIKISLICSHSLEDPHFGLRLRASLKLNDPLPPFFQEN